MKKIILLTIALILGLASPDHADIADASHYLKKNVVTRRLENGITLITLNRGYAPVLAFEISFRVGSVDESYRTIGAAHLLEHMLFKGTDTIGTTNYSEEKVLLDRIEAVGETLDVLRLTNPDNVRIKDLEAELKRLQGEHRKYIKSSPYDKIYSENGGVGFNASTSKDKTGYYIELPANKLELWAKIESERLMKPVLREFYLERSNVVQERLMRYDSNGTGLLFERFLAEAFAAHPYRHPIVGWRSNIPFLSLRDVRQFYYDNYTPDRMTITIIGKQDPDRTYAVINKYFSRLKNRSRHNAISISEPPQRGERRFKLKFESNPYLIISWHKPTFPSRDDYIFDVISELLGGGQSSRLYRTLVLEKKLVSSIDVWNGAPGGRYNNLFTIFAAPRHPNTVKDVERAIYEEIDRFFKDVHSSELKKVINGLESEMVFSLSTNKGLASLLSYYQTIFGSWEYIVNYLKVIRNVTIEDIQKMKDKYFFSDNRVVGMLEDARRKGVSK